MQQTTMALFAKDNTYNYLRHVQYDIAQQLAVNQPINIVQAFAVFMTNKLSRFSVNLSVLYLQSLRISS